MNSLPSIPLATPYPWPEEEEEDDGGSTSEQDAPTPPPHTTVAATSSTPVAPGWAHLETQLLRKSKQQNHDNNNNSDGLMSDAAKRTLMRLLREQKVQLHGHTNNTGGSERSSSAMRTDQHHPINNHKPKSPVTTVIDSTMSDETVLHLAAHGQISFLGSILAVIDRYSLGCSVSSKHIIKECALTVNPSRTPGLLDAREMVLAALHFLSQTYQPSGVDGDDDNDSDAAMISLPLIRPLSITGDLERRSYEKAGAAWHLDDRMLTQVAALEEHFYASETDYRWISRDKFLPVALLAAPDLDDFYLKGTLPRQLQLQQQQQSVKGAGRTAASKQQPTKKQSSTSGTGGSTSKKEAAAAPKTKKSKSPAKTTPTIHLKTKKAKTTATTTTTTTTTGDAVRAEALRIHDETTSSNQKQPAPPASSTEEEEDDDNDDDEEEEDHF